jgi:hypothetical protein
MLNNAPLIEMIGTFLLLLGAFVIFALSLARYRAS